MVLRSNVGGKVYSLYVGHPYPLECGVLLSHFEVYRINKISLRLRHGSLSRHELCMGENGGMSPRYEPPLRVPYLDLSHMPSRDVAPRGSTVLCTISPPPCDTRPSHWNVRQTAPLKYLVGWPRIMGANVTHGHRNSPDKLLSGSKPCARGLGVKQIVFRRSSGTQRGGVQVLLKLAGISRPRAPNTLVDHGAQRCVRT